MGQSSSAFSKKDLDQLFMNLGKQLQDAGQTADIAIYGGSALVFLFDFRERTGDVDAIWRGGDSKAFQDAVHHVGNSLSLPEDWLNDGVSMFTADQEQFLMARSYPSPECQHLRVFTAAPEYILAMKVLSMRDVWTSFHNDLPDIEELMVQMKMDSMEKVLNVVHSFYPDPLPHRNMVILEKDILPNVQKRLLACNQEESLVL